jgi:hypothetical protein
MSFKDLGKNVPPHVDTPQEAELKARAASRHRAKEEKAAQSEEHRAAKKEPQLGGAAKREPQK